MPFFRSPSSAAERPHRGRENRKAPRRKVGTDGWIRLEGGFAVRSCKVVDLSTTGVQINVNGAEVVQPDLEAGDSVIHIIDGVLQP